MLSLTIFFNIQRSSKRKSSLILLLTKIVELKFFIYLPLQLEKCYTEMFSIFLISISLFFPLSIRKIKDSLFREIIEVCLKNEVPRLSGIDWGFERQLRARLYWWFAVTISITWYVNDSDTCTISSLATLNQTQKKKRMQKNSMIHSRNFLPFLKWKNTQFYFLLGCYCSTRSINLFNRFSIRSDNSGTNALVRIQKSML